MARRGPRERLRRPPRIRRWPVARRLIGTAAASTLLIPAQIVVQGVAPRSRPRLPGLWHKVACQSLGIQVRMHGRPVRRGGVLYVANHLSWADIPVLGSKLLANFVSKSEVGGWGVVGFLSKLNGTIYVERERRLATPEQAGQIARWLAGGGSVILFAEGTNSDGLRVLPFKSSLFSVLDAPGSERFLVQPITLAYTRVNGMPVTRQMLPHLAWVGDIGMGPHFASFLRLGRVRAEILVHDPVTRADFASRKELARHCHEVVADGYAQLMRGEVEPAPQQLATA